MDKILTFVRDESGLATVEYAVAGALISVAVIGAFRLLGLTVKGVIDDIERELATG